MTPLHIIAGLGILAHLRKKQAVGAFYKIDKSIKRRASRTNDEWTVTPATQGTKVRDRTRTRGGD